MCTFLPSGIFNKYITWMSCSIWARYTSGLLYLSWFNFDEYTVSPKTVLANQQIKIFPVSGILIMGHRRNKGEMGKLMGRWEEKACNSSCWQCNHVSRDLRPLHPNSPLTSTIHKVDLEIALAHPSTDLNRLCTEVGVGIKRGKEEED